MDMKNMIAQAFADMVRQKGIDKVTVKSLIEACCISRQTFYYHFQDLIEVIEWSLERAVEEMLSQSLQAETPGKAIEVFVSSTAENYELICKLMESRKRAQMENMLLKASRKYFEQLLLARCPEPLLPYPIWKYYWIFGLAALPAFFLSIVAGSSRILKCFRIRSIACFPSKCWAL